MTPEEAIRGFFAAWNTDDDGERLRLLSHCCERDAHFVSPEGVNPGVEHLSRAIGAFRRAFPRAVVVHGPVDAHGGFARLRWQTRWNDGRESLWGDDIIELAPDGRIRRLVSFNGSPREPGA